MSAACRCLIAALLLGAIISGCGEEGEEVSTSAPAPATSSATSTTEAEADAADDPAKRKPGNEASTEPDDEAKVERVVKGAIGSDDPDLVCGRLTTERYRRDSYGGVDGCVAAISAQPRTAVAASHIEVDGQAASAIAVPARGPLAGEEIEVDLVLDGGEWRVDAVVADVPAGP